nr:hypothetical protein [Tanacetum cinerariifolium]
MLRGSVSEKQKQSRYNKSDVYITSTLTVFSNGFWQELLSEANAFTMKMEILLEPTSNKLLVGDDDAVAYMHFLHVSWRGSTTSCLQPWRVSCLQQEYYQSLDTAGVVAGRVQR